ncbi:MAG: glycosyltransferase, partial [Acinetobacter sp.]
SLLKKFDIAYIGWHLNPLYRFGISPNKLMDYMMAARPVVHAVTAGNDPVAEAGCGITVPSGDVEAIVNAVRCLTEFSAAERDAIGQLGREFILHNRTYTKLAQNFLSALSS